jgi:hypothetical protein
MKSQITIASGILLAALANSVVSIPAHALTSKECSAKYKEAKKAGTLNGMKWSDFRKAQCGAQAAAAPAPGSSGAAPALNPQPLPPREEKKAARTTAPAATGNAVFPSAVSSKYASESAGKARLHTCADQYKANKATNANGGLKWIEKGGGYWSECDKHLKGSA